MQRCPPCTRTAVQSLRDHILLLLQHPCLLQLPGLLGNSKRRKTDGKRLVNLRLLWYRVLSAVSAGQIRISTPVTAISEFCKQDGWRAGSRQEYKEDLDPSDDGLDYSQRAQWAGINT